MSNEMQKFSLEPQNFEQAMQYAKLIANSDLAPKDYKGKPENCLIAIQMGAELGLKPMQAIQNIAIINGRPSLWGDALLGLLKVHPDFEDIIETVQNGVATCTIKRRNQEPHTYRFSMDDAKKAGLASKPGPWSQYPDRMLQMRARGFCARNTFPDALKGLHSAEEVRDYPREEIEVYEVVEDAKPKLPLSLAHKTDPAILQIHLDGIANANTMDELKIAYNHAKKMCKDDKSTIDDIMRATKERKEEIKAFLDSIKIAPAEEPIAPIAPQVDDEFVKAYDAAPELKK